ncbi:MAG: OsmC family protein [Thermodesulfovibrionia bacterium]|nr:OsmC family protein [Thermodesulfovibrionia bacterium]
MEDNSADKLEESLEGYKGKILEVNKGFLEWDKDLIFRVRTQMGYEIDYDANLQWGCAPTETLLASVAGCMAIDVLFFLKKMRAEIKDFKINFTGVRRPEPPQYYKSIDLLIKVKGEGITPKKMDRAISLSHDKYCSVYNALRKEIEVTTRYTINED